VLRSLLLPAILVGCQSGYRRCRDVNRLDLDQSLNTIGCAALTASAVCGPKATHSLLAGWMRGFFMLGSVDHCLDFDFTIAFID
jgi:hypothetical protein